MKLKFNSNFNYNNKAGQEVEILDIRRDDTFGGGYGLLTKLNGNKKPTWLTVLWFDLERKKLHR